MSEIYMLADTNKVAPKEEKSAPRNTPHTPPRGARALAHSPRECAPLFFIARIGAYWRALAQNNRRKRA